MKNKGIFLYPAVIQKRARKFYVYFPTIFSDSWQYYPIVEGNTQNEAIKNAKKELAIALAGKLDENEELPKPTP